MTGHGLGPDGWASFVLHMGQGGGYDAGRSPHAYIHMYLILECIAQRVGGPAVCQLGTTLPPRRLILSLVPLELYFEGPFEFWRGLVPGAQHLGI
jgi:hypothetical protein